MNVKLAGLILGGASVLCISTFPHISIFSSVSELLLGPGAILASLIWPEGVESDSAIAWITMTFLVDSLIFALIWYVVIRAIKVKAKL